MDINRPECKSKSGPFQPQNKFKPDENADPILLYGAEMWVASGKFTPDKWDKTEIEKQHASLLIKNLGLNRSTPNIAVRAEFGRLPLLLNSHVGVMELYKIS